MAALKLGIDLGTYYTKLLVQKKHRNKIIILGGKKVRTPQGSLIEGEVKDPESLSAMLKELLTPYKQKDEIFLTLAMPALIHRRMILPYVKERKLNNLVELQLEHLFSESYENYAVQYRVTGSIVEEGVKKAVITVFAIPRKTVLSLIQLIELTGFRPNIFDIQPNCVAKLVENNVIREPKDGIIAFIDLGYSMTGVHILKESRLIFTRILPVGSRLIDEAIMDFCQVSLEETEKIKINYKESGENRISQKVDHIIKGVIDRIASEIQRVFRLFAVNMQNPSINRILIYGGIAGLENIDRHLADYLNYPVELANSFESVLFNGSIQESLVTDYFNCLGSLIRLNLSRSRKELMHYV